MITHLEPDMSECKVKWALGSITANKASGVKEFQLSYFKSWKMMLWKCCTQQWPQDWKRSVFIPIPKKGKAKEYTNYCIISLISQASKVMLKILQARFQQYMNSKLPNVQVGFRKGREPEIKLPTSSGLSKKAKEFQKNIYFCLIDYAKAFDCVDHNKLWKIFQVMGIPDHLICLLRNLYAGQESTVRSGHGTTDSFRIGKGVYQGCILSPCLFNLYSKCWAGWSTSWNQDCRRSINNLRYADDTTLMAESEEELKSLLMKLKEES